MGIPFIHLYPAWNEQSSKSQHFLNSGHGMGKKQVKQKCPGTAHRSGRPAAQRHSCVGARWGRGLTEHDRSRTWRFARANQTCVGHLNDSWDISDISQISTFYSFDRFLRITLQIELKICDLYDINKIKIWYIYMSYRHKPMFMIIQTVWNYFLLKCGSCQTGSPLQSGSCWLLVFAGLQDPRTGHHLYENHP